MVRIGNFLFHYRNGLFPLAFVMLVWKYRPIFESDLVAAGVGFAVAMTGQALRALTSGHAYLIRGGRKRQVYAEELVTTGVFSHCRNPLYDGNLLVITGLGLASNSLFFMAVGVPLFLFAYRAIVAAEENFLRQKFGPQFDDYCARVNRFLPNLSGITQTARSMEFKWRRLLIKEYGSTFAWTSGMLLLVMKNLWMSGNYPMQSPVMIGLAAGLVLLILAYILARFFKKTRVR